MLSRPHQAATSSPADRAQVAAFFGTMGLFAGVLLVAAAAWLYSLTQQVNVQTATLEKIARTLDDTDTVQQYTLKTLLEKEGETGEPRKFVESLTRAQKDLDEVKAEAKAQAKLAVLAGSENRRLEAELAKAKKAEAEAAEKAKADREDYEKLSEKNKELRLEADGIWKTPQGELARKYSVTWYSAIAGWGLALLTTLGLLALWASKTPVEDQAASPPPKPPVIEEPPHQIV